MRVCQRTVHAYEPLRLKFLRRNKEDASIGSEGVPGIDQSAHRTVSILGDLRTFRVSGQLVLTSGFGPLCSQVAQEEGGGRRYWGKALASWPPLRHSPGGIDDGGRQVLLPPDVIPVAAGTGVHWTVKMLEGLFDIA